MKKPSKAVVKTVGVVIAVVALVATGATLTLAVQHYNDDLKAQGVRQYKADHCDMYQNNEKTQKWLECDV